MADELDIDIEHPKEEDAEQTKPDFPASEDVDETKPDSPAGEAAE